MEIVFSSVTSMEGYDFALVITVDAFMYHWVNGRKKKSDANEAARK